MPFLRGAAFFWVALALTFSIGQALADPPEELTALSSLPYDATEANAPGVDLTGLSLDAPDGATIYLSPGVHTGQLQVEGKSLTVIGSPEGGTILSGAGLQTPIYVGANGTLQLKDLEIAPDGAQSIAAFVQGGRLLASNVSLTQIPGAGFYVESGEGQFLGVTVGASAGDAFVGVVNATLGLYDTAISLQTASRWWPIRRSRWSRRVYLSGNLAQRLCSFVLPRQS